MHLLRVLSGKVKKEHRERLGRQKEIWDNISPSPHLKYEKLVVAFPSNTNMSFTNAATQLH